MSKRLSFRAMRQTQAAAKAEAGLLLGLKGIDWPHLNYAMFMTLERMAKQTENPTYAQSYTLVGVWLKFLKRLIERLPADNELRSKCQVEFDKLGQDYAEVL